MTEPYSYLILDARCERIREDGVIGGQAVPAAVLANCESWSSSRDFLLGPRARGSAKVEFVGSDDHPSLKVAIRGVLSEAAWQRCYVRFNALDFMPDKMSDDSLRKLRRFYDRRGLAMVRRDLAARLAKWQGKFRSCALGWKTYRGKATFYRLPLAADKHMESTSMLERLNQDITRCTLLMRISPSAGRCVRLVPALATHENWLKRDALSEFE